MTLLEHIRRGTLVLSTLGRLYLCGDPDCKVVSNCSNQCPVCGSQVMAMGTLVEGNALKGG